jgi:hypothetical protein
MLDLRRRELHRMRVSVLRQPINHRPARISQAQQLSHFIESLSRSVVARVADVLVRPALTAPLCQIQMRMPSRNDQRHHRKLQLAISLLPLLEQHGMNVTFKMIDSDQRLLQRECQSFRVADPHQQRTGEARPLSYGQSVDRFKGLARFRQRLPHDGNNRPQMFARSQLRDYTTIRLMRRDL